MKKRVTSHCFYLPLFCVIFFLLTAANSYASKYILYPTDDTYVNQLAPNNNYGRLNYIKLRGNGSYNATQNPYLKFHPGCLPEDETITGASLNLYFFYGSNMSVYLHHISDDSWNESEATWNNKPDSGNIGSLLAEAYFHYPFSWVSFDLFSTGAWDYMADQEDSYLSMMLSLPTQISAVLLSKEHYAYTPYLTVTTVNNPIINSVPIPSTIWLFLSCLLMFKFGNAKR